MLDEHEDALANSLTGHIDELYPGHPNAAEAKVEVRKICHVHYEKCREKAVDMVGNLTMDTDPVDTLPFISYLELAHNEIKRDLGIVAINHFT